ncbi:TonB-dependent receptor [Confluentibacter sediminis]|uniref:TonB-dependent receptor n=1 Tax=Confluentibacter sediminis TaxID=2219045 RepID=UPI000DACEAAD|nr:TonB-dependent receptor [Confluentibacter sediminis]
MFHKTLCAWLSFSLCTLSFAQKTFTIEGTVKNAQTQSPIAGVSIIGEGIFAVSADDGSFTLKNVGEGVYTLQATHLGYTPKYFDLEVNGQPENLLVTLSESNTLLQEVQLLGKTKEKLAKEQPLVTVEASKAFMEANRENSLMQTLSKIPGVSTINIGSGQSKPVIRGLGFNRVAVVQNGIKHEAQQWGSDHGLEIDQYGMGAIQIIKGSASFMYGSDAIAGVVNIKPAAAPEEHSFSGEVNLLGESNNNLLGISTGIQARKEKWFYRARLTFRDYGDYKVPTNRINYENYIFELHENHLRNTAGMEANASFSVGYISDHIKSETFFSNVYNKNGFFANAHGLEVRTSSIDYDRSDRDIDLPYHQVNHFKITNNTVITGNKHTLYFETGFQNNQREEHSEPVPHGYMPKPAHSKEREFHKNTFSLNIRDAFQMQKGHSMHAGVNLEFQQNTIDGWGFLIPAFNRFTAGVFAYNQLEINPNLHLQAGLRYDFGFLDTKAHVDWYPSTRTNEDGSTSYIYLQRAQNKQLDFGNMSASVGLSYLQNHTTYKINIGKSFRMPLANELASDGVNYHMYRYERGNIDLDPETSYQLDIDIDHTAELFSVGISPFVNVFDNFIYLNPTPNYFETLQIYEYTQNKVFRMGAEVRASTTLFDNLQVDASMEYVYSRQTSGAKKGFTLPFAPPLSTLLSASYQFKKLLFFKKPQFIVDYRITAAQDEIVPPEEKTAGYQVLNMALMSHFNLFKYDAQCRLKLNNAFDTKYFNHTSFYRLIDVPEAGRNISLSLTIPF